MKKKKIVITGGPGTGKTSVIMELEQKGHLCLHEISRQVTLEAQKEGISQLFLEKPLLFSEKLLEGRIKQYKEAEKRNSDVIFIDRGIPDVVAYLDYFGNDYPSIFTQAFTDYRYDQVFILPPWETIYTRDNERYESFEQAVLIHHHLHQSYHTAGYEPIEVPTGNIKKRVSYILDHFG